MKVKAGVTGAAISFRNLVEISSGSVALCWFRPCRSLYTPFWVIVICGASLYWLVPRSGMFEVLSVENTDENYLYDTYIIAGCIKTYQTH
jgi:hypothetical protein